MHHLPPAPRNGFREAVALCGYALGAALSGLALHAYLVLVEVHVVSDRFAARRADLAPLRLDAARRRDIAARSRAFVEARRSGARTTLRIGNDEINEWVAATGAPRGFSDSVRLRMHDETVAVRFSVPMDRYGFPGRYLDGELGLELWYGADGLALTLLHVDVGGSPLSPRLWDTARLLAIATRLLSRAALDRKLKRVSGFHVSDGRFVVEANQ